MPPPSHGSSSGRPTARRPAGNPRGARKTPGGAARRSPATAPRRRSPGARRGPLGRIRRRARHDSRSPLTTKLLGLLTAVGIGAIVVIVVTVAVAANGGLSAVAKTAASALGGPAAPTVVGATGTAEVVCPHVAPVKVGTITVPAGPVAGYCQDRLINAADIMLAGKAMGLDARAQSIGVMTAMGESSLVNIDHGDAVGPDSRGLFQQRGNGSWGTYSDRMNPQIAATHFFQRLIGVQGWTTRSPSLIAHAVQINADPNHYAPYWPAAEQVVAALAAAH